MKTEYIVTFKKFVGLLLAIYGSSRAGSGKITHIIQLFQDSFVAHGVLSLVCKAHSQSALQRA